MLQRTSFASRLAAVVSPLLLFTPACDESDSPVDVGFDVGFDVLPGDDVGPPDTGDAGFEDADTGAPDDGATGPQYEDSWTCVGDVTWPAPVRMAGLVQLRFIHVDAAWEETPAGDTQVKVCSGTDPACPAPTFTGTTSAGGLVDISVPTPTPHGFEGWLRVSKPGYVPSSLYLLPPIRDNWVRWSGPWGVLSQATLVATASVALDPTKAQVLVLTADCDYLFRDTPPSATSELSVTLGGRPADSHDPTDYAFFFFNVDPGTVELEAKLGERVVGRTHWMTTAGELTQGVLGPTPID
ncbi:MAG: hypothetical protein HY791_30360 [Deltaproteobacteria bacterium]|nr:hypothetical protein [Deltaproteobacteria bacterium]